MIEKIRQYLLMKLGATTKRDYERRIKLIEELKWRRQEMKNITGCVNAAFHDMSAGESARRIVHRWAIEEVKKGYSK